MKKGKGKTLVKHQEEGRQALKSSIRNKFKTQNITLLKVTNLIQ